MADLIFSSEVNDHIGKATLEWNGLIYKLEYKKEVDNSENMSFQEIIIEINAKKVHLIPSNLFWTVEGNMEIRVRCLVWRGQSLKISFVCFMLFWMVLLRTMRRKQISLAGYMMSIL